MQSDDRITGILELLSPQRDQFRSAVAEASEQLRALVSVYRNGNTSDAERAAFELGRFARGRIDPAVFAQVFGGAHTMDPMSLEWIDRAEAVLQEVASTTHMLQQVRVQPGGDVRYTVERSLAQIGRAFGAVRIAEYARAGQPIRDPAWFLELFPYSKWNRAERRIALPLVVEVNGADCNVSGLEEFLDGTQIIVLVVNGDAPPAALVRLITPNVFVAQTTGIDAAMLSAARGGPAIIALVPATCAQFVYDRATLTIQQLPADPKPIARGRASAFQQREELLQLEQLASIRPTMPDVAKGAEPQPDDLLAAWLLRQADLTA